MLLSVQPGDSELGLLFGQSLAKGMVSTAQTGATLGMEMELSQLDESALGSICSWSVENISNTPGCWCNS